MNNQINDDSSSDISFYHEESSENLSYGEELNDDDEDDHVCITTNDNVTARTSVHPSLIDEKEEEEIDATGSQQKNHLNDEEKERRKQIKLQLQEAREIKIKILKEKKMQLLQKIHQVKNKQIQILTETSETNHQIDAKLYEYNEILSKRRQSLSHYSEIQREYKSISDEKKKLDGINVLHDVFYIFHRGHFATINGLRLGMSVPPPNPTGISSQSSSNSMALSSSSNNVNMNGQNDVPWHEINAGIGMIALLISTTQSKLRIRSRFTILPRGSTTKVCFNTSSNVQGQDSGTTVGNGNVGGGGGSSNNNGNAGGSAQEWDLHYQPTTFSFFAKRHWNTALNILGYCLYEVIEEVKRRLESYRSSHSGSVHGESSSGALYRSISDGTKTVKGDPGTEIIIPYAVELSGDWKSERSVGYVKIGGLDIGFQNDGILWTKALRYVALDLKWAVAFIAKYVDV